MQATPISPGPSANVENILNPPNLSLDQLVLHADPIVQAALVLLLILSIWSWAIMLEKAFEVMRAKLKWSGGFAEKR